MKTNKKTAKKTIKKTKTEGNILNAAGNIQWLETTFKELRAEGDYYSLGQIFWDIFLVADRKTKYYKTADKLWLSLSEDEQAMCEG